MTNICGTMQHLDLCHTHTDTEEETHCKYLWGGGGGGGGGGGIVWKEHKAIRPREGWDTISVVGGLMTKIANTSTSLCHM